MAVEDTARINGDIVMVVYRSLQNGAGGIHTAKEGLKALMQPDEKDGALIYPWQYFRMVDTSGVTIMDATQNPPKSFREFIEAPPLRGLGENIEDLKGLLKDDPIAMARWRDLTVGQHGGDRKSENIKSNNITLDSDLFTEPEPGKKKAARGTSIEYLSARLRDERPDLFAKVVAKELTANRAAVEAGWRKTETALEMLQRGWRKATSDEQRQFLEWMSNEA